MKTKEIDVELTLGCGFLYSMERMYLGDDYDQDTIKAKLIIEIPEKKIEITESEFESVWERHISCHEGFTNKSYREAFKKELGF